ncbi:MAG: class I SAM-dependent methyltransferase [Parachlamydiaceae bacterium]
MTIQEHEDIVSIKKRLDQQIDLKRLASFLPKRAAILEYGCQDGDLVARLRDFGYPQVFGYESAKDQIEKGRSLHPQCDLRHLKKPGKIPLKNESVHAVILSGCLSAMLDIQTQQQLLIEVFRILPLKGLLCLSDFLISDLVEMKTYYERGWQELGEWGLYQIEEQQYLRHHSTRSILSLLHNFDIQWFEQFNLEIPDSPSLRTFQCIAYKS